MLSCNRLPGISLPWPHLRWWWTTWFVFRSSATLYSFVWSQHRLPRKGGSSTLEHKGHMKTSRRGNVGFDLCLILAYTNCWTNRLSMIWARGSPHDVTFIAECLRREQLQCFPKIEHHPGNVQSNWNVFVKSKWSGEQTIEMLVIRDAIALIMTSLKWKGYVLSFHLGGNLSSGPVSKRLSPTLQLFFLSIKFPVYFQGTVTLQE